MNDAELEKILKYDAIDEAEKMFGTNTKEAEAFGLGSFLLNNELKKEALIKNNDTPFSCSLERYVEIIEDNGFELALKDDDVYVYWQNDIGVLLVFDTYSDRINGGNMYYNWLVDKNSDIKHKCTHSGQYQFGDDRQLKLYDIEGKKHILHIGSCDCREALIHNINKLRDNGTLLSNWIEPDFCFGLAVGKDYRREDSSHKEISLKRLEMLPDHIKSKIQYEQILKNHG